MAFHHSTKYIGVQLTIELIIGSDTACVNDKETKINAVPFITDGRTMIPVRFVSEAMDCRVDWEEGFRSEPFVYIPNKISIWSEKPVTLPTKNAAISSKIYKETKTISEQDGISYTNSYDIVIPMFSQMSDKALENNLNNHFKLNYEEQLAYADSLYDDQINSDVFWSAEVKTSFNVVNDSSNILSILVDKYEYTGGAHGMTARTGMNIDLKSSKILILNDIIKENAEEKLIETINRVKLSYSHMYENVEDATELPSETGFYFKNGYLVIFYHPYELSSFARGFVEFEIPPTLLKDIIKEEYLNFSDYLLGAYKEISQKYDGKTVYDIWEGGENYYYIYHAVVDENDNLLHEMTNDLIYIADNGYIVRVEETRGEDGKLKYLGSYIIKQGQETVFVPDAALYPFGEYFAGEIYLARNITGIYDYDGNVILKPDSDEQIIVIDDKLYRISNGSTKILDDKLNVIKQTDIEISTRMHSNLYSNVKGLDQTYNEDNEKHGLIFEKGDLSGICDMNLNILFEAEYFNIIKYGYNSFEMRDENYKTLFKVTLHGDGTFLVENSED